MSLEQLERKSLQEINQSVKVPKRTSFWRTLLLFSGPGSLVAVGYMDPGNWRCWRGSLSLLALVGGSLVFLDCHAIATDGWETRDCPSERFGPDNSDAFAQVAPLYSLDSD